MKEDFVVAKKFYDFCDVFKVKFRSHKCYKCGTKLDVVKHRKVVSRKSEEAKYYSFSVGGTSVIIGACEFIHKVFYCSKCGENIEFITQTNQEDIDIIINKVKKYFNEKGRKVNIKKYFESEKYKLEGNFNIEQVRNLCLLIEEEGKEPLTYKVPIRRKEIYERPHYFKVTKKQVIDFIKKTSQ